VRILFWLLILPFLTLVGAFAASNPEVLTLKLWPFPFQRQVPVYAAVLSAFLLGIVVAALWVWTVGLGDRLARRRVARHERALERETVRLTRELAEKSRTPHSTTDAGQSRREAKGEDKTRARRLVAAGDS
jgi:uncharacterized integral membrane protein